MFKQRRLALFRHDCPAPTCNDTTPAPTPPIRWALQDFSSPALAQAPAPKWSDVDQAVGKENYAEAKKQADAIIQSGTPEDRQKTMLVYGRILLGLGQKDQARQYLNMLSGQGSGRKGRKLPSPSGRGAGGGLMKTQ